MERNETYFRNTTGGEIMKRIRNFVKNTFKNVPKENREEIIQTVTETLIEKVEDLMDHGYTLDQAVDKTVIEFGTVEDYFSEQEKPKRFKRIKTVAHYRNDFLFSVFGSLIIISMLVFINLYFTKGILWFVIPSVALLWWPLAVLYNLLNKKENKKGEEHE